MKTPKDYLVKHLLSEGYASIKSNQRSLNLLAIKLYRGLMGVKVGSFTGSLKEKIREFSHLSGPGEIETDLFATKTGEKIKFSIPDFRPKIIMDFSMWSYHSKAEKGLLIKQTNYTLSVIRDYLWDKNLEIVSAPLEMEAWARDTNFFGKVSKEKFKGNAIVLDPNAESEIKKFDEKTNYIIGGIVDKSNRMRTSSLGYDLPRKSLRLEGKSSKVSNRINHIVEAICRNLAGEPLKEVTPRSRS